MKLVIVKAKVRNKSNLIKNIQAAGHDFGRPIFQHDRVFLPRGFEPSRKLPKMILRTEIVDPKRKPWYQLVQKRHIEAESVDLVFLTGVLNYTETANMLQQLGFELKAEVVRNRQKLQVEKELDKDETEPAVRKELWDVLKVLGIDETAKEIDTYTAQILKKK